MVKKLTRNAMTLLFCMGLVVLFIVGYLFIRDKDSVEEPVKSDEEIVVVAEDVKLSSVYVGSISKEENMKNYQPIEMTIKEGTKISGVKMSMDQTFIKYLQLQGPNGNDTLIKSSKNIITHNAYSLLLVGDIVENKKNQTYYIENARITYDMIPLVLNEKKNTITISDSKKTKEKTITMQEFIDSLKDVEKRNKVISW